MKRWIISNSEIFTTAIIGFSLLYMIGIIANIVNDNGFYVMLFSAIGAAFFIVLSIIARILESKMEKEYGTL